MAIREAGEVVAPELPSGCQSARERAIGTKVVIPVCVSSMLKFPTTFLHVPIPSWGTLGSPTRRHRGMGVGGGNDFCAALHWPAVRKKQGVASSWIGGR